MIKKSKSLDLYLLFYIFNISTNTSLSFKIFKYIKYN